MKLSDYVFSFLQNKKIDTVFYLAGGGCMHLVDSLGKNDSITPVSLLHEQAVAVAAEGYANTSGMPGVALVTTGPGGTNAITGVLAAYLDSSPCFVLSGQVKTADLKSRFNVRAHGSQEADVVSMVSNITKYAVLVTDKNKIRYHVERAWHEMTTGRRGPVWIDIPLDIQGADINPEALEGFIPTACDRDIDVSHIITALNQATRPVIIAGNGLINCKDAFYTLADTLNIPIIPTWKAMDYIPNSHALYAGKAGGMGDRHGNLTMQNADLLLCLGCRLDFSITGFDRTEWAVNAKKIVVDIDEAEINKLKGARDVVPVVADVSAVVDALLQRKAEIKMNDISIWMNRINEWKQRYPISTKDKHISATGKLTTYALIDNLCAQLKEGAHVAPCSAGTTAEIFFQAFTTKSGQKVRSSHGLGSMGFEVPNAIGMCFASGKNDVVCIAGDGGVQLNIQELAVIRGNNLPIKIFVVNNNGYASIRNMQNNHFEGRHVGCDGDNGLYLPAIKSIADAYGLMYYCVDNINTIEATIADVLNYGGAVLCEVIVDVECLVTPRTATQIMPDGTMRSSKLENQFPFLPEAELQRMD